MRARLAALILAALPLSWPMGAPAAAQERPNFIPMRDVALTYRVTGGQGSGQELRMAWLTAEGKLRVDMPGNAGWAVVDQRAQRVLVVMDAQRLVMEVPAGTVPIPTEPPASARFTRGGTETVAGLSCTLWRYEEGPNKGEACLTADGVMLRSRGGRGGERSGSVEAVAVAYGAQDPARFQPPAGYRGLQLPPGLALPGTSPGALPGAPPGAPPPAR